VTNRLSHGTAEAEVRRTKMLMKFKQRELNFQATTEGLDTTLNTEQDERITYVLFCARNGNLEVPVYYTARQIEKDKWL
jgi:hypothetical protein